MPSNADLIASLNEAYFAVTDRGGMHAASEDDMSDAQARVVSGLGELMGRHPIESALILESLDRGAVVLVAAEAIRELHDVAEKIKSSAYAEEFLAELEQ